jgi:hypothetical protein
MAGAALPVPAGVTTAGMEDPRMAGATTVAVTRHERTPDAAAVMDTLRKAGSDIRLRHVSHGNLDALACLNRRHRPFGIILISLRTDGGVSPPQRFAAGGLMHSASGNRSPFPDRKEVTI